MRLRLVVVLVVLAALAGCTGDGDGPLTDVPETLAVSSEAFSDGDPIPEEHTCDGADVSPPLEVADVPGEAEGLALLVSDPDAPGGTFDHWVAWNRPPGETRIAEGESGDGFAGEEGVNDFEEWGWSGPCPPEGEEHRYVFRVVATRSTLDLGADADGGDLREALKGEAEAQGILSGLYER